MGVYLPMTTTGPSLLGRLILVLELLIPIYVEISL